MQRHAFDDDYVRRLAGGDPETQRHFTSYFGDLLTAKLRFRLRYRNQIEDVKQETFLRVLRIVGEEGGLKDARALGSFVLSVCKNILNESYRDQSRIADPPEDSESDEMDAETALVDGQERAAVRAVLAGMPEKDARFLRWYYFEEIDKDEICRRLNVDRDYLRVLLHRAKVSFRIEYLKRQDPPSAGLAAGAGG